MGRLHAGVNPSPTLVEPIHKGTPISGNGGHTFDFMKDAGQFLMLFIAHLE